VEADRQQFKDKEHKEFKDKATGKMLAAGVVVKERSQLDDGPARKQIHNNII
jgi:hypothetical protein